MKTYNHALDYLALAGEQLSIGRPIAAAKCLAKAVTQPDFPMAIAIIEANNQAAYNAAASAATAKKPVAAKSKVLSAEDAALESLVGDLDELDEEGDEDLDEEEEGEEVEAEVEPEGEPEEVEDEAEEEEDEEEQHEAALRAALASMTKPKKTAATAKRKPAAARK